MASVRNIDVKVRYAYVRFKRKLQLYITLWFLALLAAVSLILDSIFIEQHLFALKVWSAILVVLLGMKLAYDIGNRIKRDYMDFKEEHGQTGKSLRYL